MRILVLLLFAAVASAADLCPTGVALGEFRMTAFAPGREEGLPVHILNRLGAGSRIVFSRTGGAPGKDAEVALLVASADQSQLAVVKPKRIGKSTEWVLESDISLGALIWGPEGLDEGRIRKFGERERPLIVQLARYAEQTAMTETLLKALSANNSQAVDSAISSFAAQFGTGGRLDRSAPPEQQMLTMLRSVNPALASYDPLAPEPNVRLQQSAMLAASVAGMFFGSTVGLGAGSAALLANMRTLLFPKMGFRTSFVQASGEGFALCGRTGVREHRTKPAYVWAFQLAGLAAPAIAFPGPVALPVGVKTTVSVDIKGGGAAAARKVREWRLGETPVAVRFPADNQMEFDLTAGSWTPGVHRVVGMFDWAQVDAGPVDVVQIPDLSRSRPDDESHDRLQTGSSSASIRITGGDFRFVEDLAWKRRDPAWAEAKALRFRREGRDLVTALDLRDAAAGEYALVFKQRGGRVDEAPVTVLERPPQIEGLPLRVNLGAGEQRFRLRGQGVERIRSAESDGIQVNVQESVLTTLTGSNLEVGDRLILRLRIEGYRNPVGVPEAIVVAGPLPAVSSVRAAAQQNEGLELRTGELAAGSVMTLEAKAERLGSLERVRLRCQGAERGIELRAGDAGPEGRVRLVEDSRLLVSFDPARIGGAGCEVTLEVESENGWSPAAGVGRIVRLPRLRGLVLSDEPSGAGRYWGHLEGEELELIAKIGWDAVNGVEVRDLPVAKDAEQRLRVEVPWPSPTPRARLFVWLHGDMEGRRSGVRF